MLKISNKLIVLFLFFLVVSACSSSDSSGPTLVEISSDEESEDFEEENEDEEDSDEVEIDEANKRYRSGGLLGFDFMAAVARSTDLKKYYRIYDSLGNKHDAWKYYNPFTHGQRVLFRKKDYKVCKRKKI